MLKRVSNKGVVREEKRLVEKEKTMARKEGEIQELQKRVRPVPKEMGSAINKAVTEVVERVQVEAKNREELLKREFSGERNELNTRIESLEKNL